MNTLVLLLGVLNAASEPAAPDTFGQRGDWGVLLAREDVRGELKLGEKEEEEIKDLLAKHADDEVAVRENVAKSLTVDQLSRLRQLGWQAAEGYALLDDVLAKQLKFTAKQRESLAEAKAMNAAKHAEMKSFLARARFRSAEAMQAYIEEYRSAASGLLLAVLTADQTARLKKLCGEPFEFKKES